jgi:hypothetical protein
MMPKHPPVDAVFPDNPTNDIYTHYDPATGHRYLSTGCLHGKHGYCQSDRGSAGDKIPAKCKFCDAQCRCPCHRQEATG